MKYLIWRHRSLLPRLSGLEWWYCTWCDRHSNQTKPAMTKLYQNFCHVALPLLSLLLAFGDLEQVAIILIIHLSFFFFLYMPIYKHTISRSISAVDIYGSKLQVDGGDSWPGNFSSSSARRSGHLINRDTNASVMKFFYDLLHAGR